MKLEIPIGHLDVQTRTDFLLINAAYQIQLKVNECANRFNLMQEEKLNRWKEHTDIMFLVQYAVQLELAKQKDF